MPRSTLFVLVTFAVMAVSPVAAQEAKEDRPPVTLKVGDPAPVLNVTTWLQGAPVSRFEKGKIYVVEFWAVWCGPCIAFMPHLAEMQQTYGDKGVTIIGYTCADPQNTEAQATAFVKKRGPGLKYHFAFADNDATYKAWMTAAGRNGIPCNFVIDREGKIAYIGHPLYLAMVLSLVAAEGADAKSVGATMAKVEAAMAKVSEAGAKDEKECLRVLRQFEAEFPALTDFFLSVKVKLSFLPKHGEPGEAEKYAAAVIDRAIEKKDVLVLSLASAILRRGDGKEFPELRALAVKAAAAEVAIDGGKNAGTLIALADAHFLNGDQEKARDYAARALKAASGESESLRKYIREEARRMGVQ